MMENTLGIDDLKLPEAIEVSAVEDRALLDRPVRIFGEVATLQLQRTGDRLFVVVERPNACAQPPCGEAEQTRYRNRRRGR